MYNATLNGKIIITGNIYCALVFEWDCIHRMFYSKFPI